MYVNYLFFQNFQSGSEIIVLNVMVDDAFKICKNVNKSWKHNRLIQAFNNRTLILSVE